MNYRVSRSTGLLRWLLLTSLLCPLASQAAGTGDPATLTTDAAYQAAQAQNIPIDQRIYLRPWNPVPFDTQYFTYSQAQLKTQWDHLVRSFKLPYPSVELIEYAQKHYPEILDGVSPDLAHDPVRYQAALMDVGRDFMAGNYQQAYRSGKSLGALGIAMGAFAETIYACYLTEHQSVKYMMLQDVVNTFDKYKPLIHRVAVDKNPELRSVAAFVYLGYAYALARIAEESPIPVVLARDYVGKLKFAADQVLQLSPNQPLGLAFRAGLDAGIMRRVGKFTGRMTYGARTTTTIDDFGKSVDLVPDQAITQYEFANALIYMDQKRELNSAMRHLETAIRSRPTFAMEALDSMYAYKRLQEVRLYALDYRSFRQFDKDRRNFISVTDRNLTNVMSPNLTLDMLQHPEKYKLPPLK